MSDQEFRNHVEALAVRRLDKPKKLSSECTKHWKEILSRQYNFDRGGGSFNLFHLWQGCKLRHPLSRGFSCDANMRTCDIHMERGTKQLGAFCMGFPA